MIPTAQRRPGQRESRQELSGLIVADDLTGAADSAVAFATAGLRTQVVFAGPGGTAEPATSDGSAGGVLALDTDSRRLHPAAAHRAVADAATKAPAARFRMKKIDSTLRGNVRSETLALMEALGCTVAICAPAFPAADRHTRDGRQWASGRLVGEVAASFEGVRTAHIPLGAVRDGSIHALVDDAVTGGAQVVVVDAVTQQDLRSIVTSGADRDDLLWVGSGGLGAALADATTTGPALRDPIPRVTAPIVTIVGSATPVAAAQARCVVDSGAVEVPVPVGVLLDASADGGAGPTRLDAALEDGRDVLVRLEEGDTIVPGHGRAIVEALAAALAPSLRRARPGALVATGGETALAFGRALGARGLDIIAELEPGVVFSRLLGETDLPLVTKAGAFGDPGTLARTLEILRETDQPEGL